MINKKTIAVKQDIRGIITRGILDMTHAELVSIQLAVDRVLAKRRTLQEFLSKLGRVYEVPFSDGQRTTAVILTYKGIRRLRIDLNTVFKGCGGKEVFNVKTDVKNGVLVNLDLYQQAALLRAIIEKKPKLRDILGLYNLRGSRKVFEILSREGVLQRLSIWWMWTGERYIPGQDNEDVYPEEGIVTLSNLSPLKDNLFVGRDFDDGSWHEDSPDTHFNHGVVIFGLKF